MKDIFAIKSDLISLPPSRNEFFTNYPFFKYWKKDNNEKLTSLDGINIYIHIPFCIQICDYCFYMKELIKSKNQVDDYINFLCSEIELVSKKFSLEKREVNSIYMGGGTPSILTEVQFTKLMNCLRKFHKIDNPEFTIEVEPGTFSKTKLEWYHRNGINRVSMGVQSFDDEIIRLSNRKHTAQQAINSITMVKEFGTFVLNIDLLSGLAGESDITWSKSLTEALALEVEMLTIYKMKAYSNTTVFNKGVKTKQIALPSDDQELEFMSHALDMVLSKGYKRWSSFAFTRNDYKHSYIENTWRGHDSIAYGVSAFGKIGNNNYQNHNDTKLYYDKLTGNEMPISRTYPLTAKDSIIREVLLCSTRLVSYRKSEFIAKFGFDYFDLIPETIEALIQDDFLVRDPIEIVLTKRGVLFGDYVGQIIATSIKDKLGQDQIGFSY